jgi:glycosyltransferase involved in cell wall biosynthesis
MSAAREWEKSERRTEATGIGRPFRLSVIVPVHNGEEVLGRCLAALSRSMYPNFEVIVVDDCSTDSTREIARQYGRNCIQTAKTMGPAAARNLGSKHATGEILVFVDADVVITASGLQLIAQAFENDLKLSALFGSYDDEPACRTFISQYKNLLHHYVHQSSNQTATTFWAGYGAIRKDIFECVGGFDSDTYAHPSIEDIALGLELVRRGYSVRLEKGLTAKHLKCWTISSLVGADIFHRAVPWTRLILRSGQAPRDLNLTYGSRVSAVLGLVLCVSCLLLPLAIWNDSRGIAASLAIAIAALAAALVYLNRDLYRFFFRKRGPWFTMRAVFVHWAYYVYSSATFAVVAAGYAFGLGAPRRGASAIDQGRSRAVK